MRKTVARLALVLVALGASVAFGPTVASCAAATTGHASAAATAQLRDDVRAVATAPARTTDWVVGQAGGGQGGERVLAVLLAATVVLVAQSWRRTARASRIGCAALLCSRTGIRGPPASV